MNLNFATKDAKSVVCDRKCDFPIHNHRFSYTQPLSKPEAGENNKHIRNMTKFNAASNTAKPFNTNMEALMDSSSIKVKWVISSG